MAFHFSLAAVLRVRESLEHREQLALEQSYRHLYSVQKELSDQDERLTQIRASYEEELRRGTMAAGLHCLLHERARAERNRVAIEQRLSEAQNEVRRHMESYRRARQQRETVTQVRNHRFAAYQKKEALAEQKVRDDLYLLRRRRHD